MASGFFAKPGLKQLLRSRVIWGSVAVIVALLAMLVALSVGLKRGQDAAARLDGWRFGKVRGAGTQPDFETLVSTDGQVTFKLLTMERIKKQPRRNGDARLVVVSLRTGMQQAVLPVFKIPDDHDPHKAQDHAAAAVIKQQGKRPTEDYIVPDSGVRRLVFRNVMVEGVREGAAFDLYLLDRHLGGVMCYAPSSVDFQDIPPEEWVSSRLRLTAPQGS